jgi:SAM-dependent methyltransferase
MNFTLERRNQITRDGGERWRPVPCVDLSPFRRFFDLQAGSIWSDLSTLLPASRGTLVDVGCGAQPYRRLVANGTEYIGIDTIEAKEAFGYETPGVRYYDGFTWPLNDASADVVVATETLEHVPDPQHFANEAARVLRSGGSVILTAPFAARWHFIPHDYWRFTPSGFRSVLEAAGFTDIRVYARGNAVTVASYKVLALLAALLLPQSDSPRTNLLLRLAGLPFVPLFLMLAVAGNLSLRSRDGDDCLGYTVVANKRGVTP